MQDYFTKWPEAIPLKDTTAKSVAGVLLLVILMWGPPAELLSNQFVAELNCELSRKWRIKRQWNSDPHIPGIPARDEQRSVLNKDS